MSPAKAMLPLILAGMAAGLGACNTVMTLEPLYERSDALGAPRMKEGLWARVDDGCKVDLNTKHVTWPDCASGWVYRYGVLWVAQKTEKDLYGFQVILASGNPRVLQMEFPAAEPVVGEAELEKAFLYQAVEPIKTDEVGRITEYQSWTVQCGPMPPNDTRRGKGIVHSYTKEPGPGLTMVKGGNCLADGREAVVTAARASRNYNNADVRITRWLRDAD